MELSMLTVIFAMSVACLELAAAKSNPVVMQDGKLGFTQKLNAVSSTSKPEFQYHSLNQYQSIQPDKQYNHQNHLPSIQQQLQQHQVNLPQLPAPAQLNQQSQQRILQLIQKALYTTQQSNQPTAMIIIAQPAYTSGTVNYGSPSGQTQQLLNYFHGNPQARYQLLHGNTQQQQQQQPIQQFLPQFTAAQSSGNNQIVQAPQQYQQNFNPLPTPLPLTTHMSPVQPSENYHQQTPLHLSQISQLAEMTSQHFFQPSSQQYSFPSQQYDLESRQNDLEQQAPLRSLPPIITGFENFSPEQQAKIKAQLSAHFGAPLQELPAGQDQKKENRNSQDEKYRHYQPKHQFGASSLEQNQDNDNGFGQFSKFPNTLSTRLNIQEFMPSQQVKSNGGGNSLLRVPTSSFAKM